MLRHNPGTPSQNDPCQHGTDQGVANADPCGGNPIFPTELPGITYEDDGGEIGFISSVSEPFCKECSRMRLSVDGKIYNCLFATTGFDIRQMLRGGATDEEIEEAIGRIW